MLYVAMHKKKTNKKNTYTVCDRKCTIIKKIDGHCNKKHIEKKSVFNINIMYVFFHL